MRLRLVTFAVFAVLAAPAQASAAATEVASVPGGGEVGFAGPAFAGARVVFGWVDANQVVHVRSAGDDQDLWSVAPPPPPPPSSPQDDTSVKSVTQELVGFAAGTGGVAVARRADLTVEPACVNSQPACEIAVMARPYVGELASGAVAGPLVQRLGYGPVGQLQCPPASALDVTGLAASGSAFAAVLAPPYCAGGRAHSVERIQVRSFGGHTVAVLKARAGRTIDAVATAGRWVAWLFHATSTIGTRTTTATLVIYDLSRRRVRLRRSLTVGGPEGPAGVRLAIEPDGRAAVLLPGPDSAPCEASATLAGLSPAHPQIHRIRVDVAPASSVALAGGRALVELSRPNSGSGCPEPGSIAAVRLSDGATTTLATLAPDEIATGTLAWDGTRAGFAAIVPEQAADGSVSYRTAVRVATG